MTVKKINEVDKVKVYNANVERNKEYNLRLEEYYIWYKGISDLIVDFYLNRQAMVFPKTHEQFRNTRDYFWVATAKEKDFKKTHSGIPRRMVKLLSAVTGKPKIDVKRKDDKSKKIEVNRAAQDRLDNILKGCKFYRIIKNKQQPLTLVYGDGAFFSMINTDVSEYPFLEYYPATNVEFEYYNDMIVSITAKRYIIKDTLAYVLCEKRSTRKVDNKKIATIDYELYRLKSIDSDEVLNQVDLSKLEETKALVPHQEFPSFNRVLATPIIYDLDDETGRGTSLFAGRLDLFDDLDQSLSQRSNSVRLSTPVEYMDQELVDYDENGTPKKPKRYDRRFILTKGDKNAVGQINNKIETNQPQLNFSQYSDEALETLMLILDGTISPATMGIELARKDNALAQREKEKITMQTRDDIIEMQMEAIEDICNLLLQLDDYMKSEDKSIKITSDYMISVNYPEYASPTFDAKLQTLVPAYTSGIISPEKVVNELWGDSLTEEEKQKEIKWLEENKQNNTQSIPGEDEIDPLSYEGE